MTDTTTIRVTLLDADCKVLWVSPITVPVQVAKRTPSVLSATILSHVREAGLPLLAGVEEIKTEEKGEPVIHVDAVDIDLIKSKWAVIAANPNQLDWSHPAPKTPKW